MAGCGISSTRSSGSCYESLRERERLLKLAPHLVEPLELFIPVYRGARRKRWQIGVGLALYDLLSVGQVACRGGACSAATSCSPRCRG